MSFKGNKTDAAQFVKEVLEASKPSSLSIMIMEQDKSGDCFVRTAIAMSSDEIVEILGQAIYSQLMSTS